MFRKLSVEDNILAILEMTGRGKAERERKLEELLSEFSLQHVRTNLGDVLSGKGEHCEQANCSRLLDLVAVEGKP